MFKPVSREQNRLRLALCGPSGAGKTYTALVLAHALIGPQGRIALIDTEHGSASKYAGTQADGHTWAWDHLSLEHYAPARYIDAIQAANDGSYDVLVIDSLSHAWAGTGGALDQVDHSRDANKFGAWRSVTPQHNALVEAILACRCHVIATMRSKTEYVLEADERGKQVPRKIGTKPIQRDGVEYEFDIVADLDHQHTMTVSKTRCPAVDGDIVHRPTGSWIEPVRRWLYDGAIPASRPVVTAPSRPAPEAVTTTPAAPATTESAPGNGGGTRPRYEWTTEHQRLADAIMYIAKHDPAVAADILEKHTTFEVDGKRRYARSVKDMSLKWVRSTWNGSVKKLFEDCKKQDEAEAQAQKAMEGEQAERDRAKAGGLPLGADPLEEEAAIEATRAVGDELPF